MTAPNGIGDQRGRQDRDAGDEPGLLDELAELERALERSAGRRRGTARTGVPACRDAGDRGQRAIGRSALVPDARLRRRRRGGLRRAAGRPPSALGASDAARCVADASRRRPVPPRPAGFVDRLLGRSRQRVQHLEHALLAAARRPCARAGRASGWICGGTPAPLPPFGPRRVPASASRLERGQLGGDLARRPSPRDMPIGPSRRPLRNCLTTGSSLVSSTSRGPNIDQLAAEQHARGCPARCGRCRCRG